MESKTEKKTSKKIKRRKDPKSWDDCRRSFNKGQIRNHGKYYLETWKSVKCYLKILNYSGSFSESSNTMLEILITTHFRVLKIRLIKNLNQKTSRRRQST